MVTNRGTGVCVRNQAEKKVADKTFHEKNLVEFQTFCGLFTESLVTIYWIRDHHCLYFLDFAESPFWFL
jgi:hypothetical protein